MSAAAETAVAPRATPSGAHAVCERCGLHVVPRPRRGRRPRADTRRRASHRAGAWHRMAEMLTSLAMDGCRVPLHGVGAILASEAKCEVKRTGWYHLGPPSRGTRFYSTSVLRDEAASLAMACAERHGDAHPTARYLRAAVAACDRVRALGEPYHVAWDHARRAHGAKTPWWFPWSDENAKVHGID